MTQKIWNLFQISIISPEKCTEVEMNTRLQALSSKWSEVRLRLTASNFGTICKATDKRDKIALARSLTERKDLKTPAILHGRKYESVAVEHYCKKYDLTASVCGFFISDEYPMLGASPDRVVGDQIVLEVKCPFSSKEKNISAVTVPYLYLKDGKLSLRENHDYYYQVQGQLYCTGRKLCHFVVYTLSDMKMLEIPRNEPFIQAMVDKLLNFYKEYFKQVIIDKYLYKNYYHYTFEY